MTYIENIFLCLAIPMILSLFFIKGRSRSYTLFVTIGMGICLLSAYVNSFFMFFSTIIFAIHILCFSLSKLQYMDGIFHFIIDTLYLWFPKFKYALYFSFMISKNPAF